MLTLQQLRVLLAVVEQRSFTRGARAVHMTQSAASQHVRALEQALGVPLVERIDGEVVPTRTGEGLLGYAKDVLRVVADAERYVSAARGGSAGRMVMGASGSAVYLVPPLASGFRAAAPGIEVELRLLSRQALQQALSRGEVDVALMGGPVREAAALGYSTRAACADRLVLAVPPASPLLPAAALAPYPLQRVAELRLVALADPAPSWQLVEEWAARHGVQLRPVLRLETVDAVKKAVEAGGGAAFLSAWVVEREVALGTLRLVPVSPSPPARQYELVWRTSRPADRALEHFLGFAPAYLARWLPAALSDPVLAPPPATAPVPQRHAAGAA
jgi:DNA-binding transcriptional LysR family regulator